MDFTTDLHLMLDDQPPEISARQHPDMPETFFINLRVSGSARAHLCISGPAAQL